MNSRPPLSPTPSARILSVQEPVIPLIHQWTEDRPGTISLSQGVVSYSPPKSVVQTAEIALQEHNQALHRYGPVAGIAELQTAISHKLSDEHSIDTSGRTVFCTAGSNMAFFASVFAAANPGDEIILNTPYYFNHEMAVRIAGCTPVCVPTTEEFQPNVSLIANATTSKTRAIVTVSPNNPTGVVYRPELIREINHLCRQRGILHIHDEAYEYFVYGETNHFSPLQIPGSEPHTVGLFSLSKAYAMAGWRIGYAVLPEQFSASFIKTQDTNLICPTLMSQRLAVEALRQGKPWCDLRIAELADLRKQLLSGLSAIPGLHTAPSNGALFFLASCRSRSSDLQIVKRLIDQFGVAVLPGSTFGLPGGEPGNPENRWLRLSFGAMDPTTIGVALSRLTDGIADIAAHE